MLFRRRWEFWLLWRCQQLSRGIILTSEMVPNLLILIAVHDGLLHLLSLLKAHIRQP